MTKRLCDYGCGKEAKYKFKNGKWCCSERYSKCENYVYYNSDDIEILKEKAKQFDGECLSEKYINCGTKYKWKCVNGHIFWKTWSEIKHQNRWCQHCYLNPKEEMTRFIFEQLTCFKFIKIKDKLSKYEIDGYCKELQLAFEYNGEQHYNEIKGWHSKTTLEEIQRRDQIKLESCKKQNIQLIVIPFNDVNKKEDLEEYITSKLKHLEVIKNTKVDWNKFSFGDRRLEELKKIIEDKNAVLLSTYYPGRFGFVNVRCERGHVFNKSVNEIVNKGQLCAYCSNRKVCLDNCLATINPDLSKEWHPNKNGDLTPYDVLPCFKKKAWWLCPKCDHEWDANGDKRHGRNRGCPECGKKKNAQKNILKDGMEQILKIVELHGGKCIDKKYKGYCAGNSIICKNGHHFKISLGHLKKGKWCYKCSMLNKMKNAKGYVYNKKFNRWISTISIDKKVVNLGSYIFEENAIKIRKLAIEMFENGIRDIDKYKKLAREFKLTIKGAGNVC